MSTPAPAAAPAPLSVLILKFDRGAAATLRQCLLSMYPGANCILVRTLTEAKAALGAGVPDLFVTGMEAADGDPLDLLWTVTVGPAAVRRSLVVTRHREPWLLEALRGLPIGGMCDLVDDTPESIAAALRAVAEGGRYWSPSLDRIFADVGLGQRRLRLLTPTERLVLSLMGEGRDATATGILLGMKTRSVESTIARLYGKLGAHHQAELPVLAMRHGFVRITPTGSIRVGFGLLLSAYYTRSQRPLAPSVELRAAYPEATALAGDGRMRFQLRAA